MDNHIRCLLERAIVRALIQEPGAHVCYADVTETLDFDVRIDEFDDIQDPEPEAEPIACNACKGIAYPLGDLGSRRHFRCQACGWQVSKHISEL